MAFTTPKTGFIAGEGFAYTDINKTNENIRVLAGGDNTLPLSTDAATGKALAKRDADGDIAFRDIAARYVTATGLYMTAVAAGEYIIPGFGGLGGASPVASYTKVAEYKCPCEGTLRVLFRLRSSIVLTTYGRIYKNGTPIGIERSTALTSATAYNEDLSFVYGDLIQLYVKGDNQFAAIVSDFSLKYNGPGALSLY